MNFLVSKCIYKRYAYIMLPFITILRVLSCSLMSDSLQPHGLYVARQAPLSMGFSRQEYWSGLPCPPPGESSQPRNQSQVSSMVGGFFTIQSTREQLSMAEISFCWLLVNCHPTLCRQKWSQLRISNRHRSY